MADNVTTQSAAPATVPAGTPIAARTVTYSGDASQLIAPVGLVAFAGADDAKTATDVPAGGGTEAAALRVTLPTDGTGQVKLAASSAVIGHVIVDTAPSTAVTGPLTDTQLRASTVPISGTVTESNLPATVDTNSGAKSASTIRVVLATDQPQLTAKLLVTPDSVALPANQSVNVAQMNGVATTMGAGNSGTGTQRVVVATDQATLPISVPAVAVAAAVTQVVSSAASVTLLSSNAARKGFKLFNDSTAIAYIKEGTTAVIASDHSYQLQPKGFYESVGVGVYTGRIDCIWASANGNMRVTENS